VLSVWAAELYHAFARLSLTLQEMQLCVPPTVYIDGLVSAK